MNKTLYSLLVGMILLAGCQSIDTTKITPSYKASLYDNGKELKTIDIPQNSDLEKQIQSFLIKK